MDCRHKRKCIVSEASTYVYHYCKINNNVELETSSDEGPTSSDDKSNSTQSAVDHLATRLFWHSDVDLSPGHTNTSSIYPTQNLFFIEVYIIIYTHQSIYYHRYYTYEYL